MPRFKTSFYLLPALTCGLIDLLLLICFFHLPLVGETNLVFDMEYVIDESITIILMGSILIQLFFVLSVYYYCRKSKPGGVFTANFASFLYLLLIVCLCFNPIDLSGIIILFSVFYLIMLCVSYIVSPKQIYSFLWLYPIAFFVLPMFAIFVRIIVTFIFPAI